MCNISVEQCYPWYGLSLISTHHHMDIHIHGNPALEARPCFMMTCKTVDWCCTLDCVSCKLDHLQNNTDELTVDNIGYLNTKCSYYIFAQYILRRLIIIIEIISLIPT